MKCCVSICVNQHKSSFLVPKDNLLLKEWERSLGMNLESNYRVCASHFQKYDIIDQWVSGRGQSKYTVSTYIKYI